MAEGEGLEGKADSGASCALAGLASMPSSLSSSELAIIAESEVDWVGRDLRLFLRF